MLFRSSAALLRGVCARCKELGYKIGGFEAFTMTRVLKGSGLSSSAAFEVLIVTILSHLYNDGQIDPVTAAKIAQYAENVYFGKPSGLLDQMASSVGGFTSIDFKDPEAPVIEKVDFDISAQGYALCVVDTGGNHANLTGEYAAIPAEMKQVAAYFGKEFLREVDEKEFYEHIGDIRKQTGDRAVLRAMHFFDENRRAQAQAQALAEGDMEGFLALVRASGRSSSELLQNIWSVAEPAQQAVTLALALAERVLAGRGAVRVHGGGFAGTVLAYLADAEVENYVAQMAKVFGRENVFTASVRLPGATELDLGELIG